MKTNSILVKVSTYFKELTIVTAGVLLALFISNHKENSQARAYHKVSIETLNNEVESNYTNLKAVVEKQTRLLDSISKYRSDQISISGLIIEKGGGLQIAQLSNSGLEFYKKNQINSIDFEIMTKLISMESTSILINTKMEKLMDYLYPNFFNTSEESKDLFILYLSNALNSEVQLMNTYKDFIDDYIENENSDK